MLTVGSLFTGIGGIDLGLERAGMKVLWQSEIDPYACRVLAKHWPDVPNLGDVREVEWAGVAAVDLVAGGFPCQPVSGAGKKQAQEDDRWLWPEFARAVRHLRPDDVLVENVVGLFARGFGDVLGDLAALGYDAEWDCLPAEAVGAPHRRVRVLIHARRDDGPAQPVADTHGQRRQEQRGAGPDFEGPAWLAEPERRGWWSTEPDVGRVVDGFPGRVDRLRALGNAVVPQVAEEAGRRILARRDGVDAR